jgi:SAM-dependent methyltransferase
MICQLCGSDRLRIVLSLGSSPPTCAMPPAGPRRTETHYPLELARCEDCTLAQLSVTPDPNIVFPADYPYSSGNSPQLHANFEDLARQIEPVDGLVVDIGANDGTLLRKFGNTTRTVGIEPTGQATKITGPRYRQFFTEQLAHQVVAEHGHASIVTACNVLAHVADLDDVMTGIRTLLAPNGLLIAENHDLDHLVTGHQWDFIYHEHLRYFDTGSFRQLLKRHGFGWETGYPIDTHGGSFRVFARKDGPGDTIPVEAERDWAGLRRAALEARAELRILTLDPVWGIGATARATTLINYCGLDIPEIECVCEVPGSDKIGRLIPGTGIPVVSETRLFEEQPPRALLFSWHLADVIIPKLRARGYDGDILVPQRGPVPC